MVERKEKNVRASADNKVHRYSGLLRCQDCGRTFLGRRIKLKSGERVEYLCDTYNRYGKEHCTAHAIREETLDELIFKELRETKNMYQQNWNMLEKVVEKWLPKASFATANISKLKDRIAGLEEDVEAILMERIRDRSNAERYDRMIEKREAEIAEAKKQIEELQNVAEVLRSRQAKLKKDISLIDEILEDGKMTEAHLRLLVDKIFVHEHDGKIDLDAAMLSSP